MPWIQSVMEWFFPLVADGRTKKDLPDQQEDDVIVRFNPIIVARFLGLVAGSCQATMNALSVPSVSDWKVMWRVWCEAVARSIRLLRMEGWIPSFVLKVGGRTDILGFREDSTTGSSSSCASPSCELYDLVLDWNWDRVQQHVKDCPWDAWYQDGDTWETPLFVACCQYQPPVAVIHALLQAAPATATWRSRRQGDLPLHMACTCQASPAILQTLIRAAPETLLRRTKYGASVLSALWEGRPSGVVIVPNKRSNNSNNNSMLTTTTMSTSADKAEEESVQDVMETHHDTHNQETSDFWHKVDLVLHAMARQRQGLSFMGDEEYGDDDDDDDTNRNISSALHVVHAAVSLGSLGCPCEILEYCLSKYRHQVWERDHSNCLPLHVALGVDRIVDTPRPRPEQQVVPNSLSVTSCSNTAHHQPKRKGGGGRLSLAYRIHQPKQQHPEESWTMLTLLLQIHPQAALIPASLPLDSDADDDKKKKYISQLALHRALCLGYGWMDGIHDLCRAAPSVLNRVDPVTGLYAFQLAAAAAARPSKPPQQDSCELTTIYQLLRRNPSVLWCSSSSLSSSSSLYCAVATATHGVSGNDAKFLRRKAEESDPNGQWRMWLPWRS